jgi:AcrR family transcriptional regulator
LFTTIGPGHQRASLSPRVVRGRARPADHSDSLVLREALFYKKRMAYSRAMAEEIAPAWAERAAERSPLVQRSRSRSVRQARVIVDAARRLMMRQGEFTTQELVKEAGVALQTFYRAFPGKNELLLALIEDAIGEEAATLEAQGRAIDDPIARLHLYVTHPLQGLTNDHSRVAARAHTAEHWRLYQLFPTEIEQASAPLIDLVQQTIIEARSKGLLRPGDAERDAWLALHLVRAVWFHYAFAPLERSIEEITEYLWSFCLQALGGHADGLDAT